MLQRISQLGAYLNSTDCAPVCPDSITHSLALQSHSPGAGTDWKLNQTQYEWLGINGNATNYGVDMEPQGGDSPVPLDAIVFPKWVEELRQTPGPTFVLTKEDSNAVANAGSNAGATGGTQTSSSAGPALLHGLMTIGVFCFMWYV